MLLTGSLQVGGAERVLSDMANYWRARGWRVTLVTLVATDAMEFYQLDPTVERVGLDSVVDQGRQASFVVHFGRIQSLRAKLSKWRPDALLSFIDRANVIALMAAAGLGLRVVVSERTHPAHYRGLSLSWRLLRKLTYRRASGVVTPTADAGRWVAKECGIAAEIIPNPLRALPDCTLPRENMIVSVGRLDTLKGFDVVLRAFARIHSEVEGWRLTIVGGGPERDSLQSLRDSLGLEELVSFEPPTLEVEQWFARAGLVVQASRLEGFGNVLIEALGMGAAVVSTDCPAGPSDIITDQENGRLVPVDDVKALAEVMSELIRQPSERERLSMNARNVRDTYNQDRIMKRWEACLFAEGN